MKVDDICPKDGIWEASRTDSMAETFATCHCRWRQFTQGQTVTGFGQGLPSSELISVAPDDTVLENFKSRMRWIDLAAKKFHGLMQTKKYFMEHQLQTIASWVGHQDDQIVTPTMPL